LSRLVAASQPLAWCDMTRYTHITCDMTRYTHMTCDVTRYTHMTPYTHITLYTHITQYHTISHNITQYHTISDDMTQYDTILQPDPGPYFRSSARCQKGTKGVFKAFQSFCTQECLDLKPNMRLCQYWACPARPLRQDSSCPTLFLPSPLPSPLPICWRRFM